MNNTSDKHQDCPTRCPEQHTQSASHGTGTSGSAPVNYAQHELVHFPTTQGASGPGITAGAAPSVTSPVDVATLHLNQERLEGTVGELVGENQQLKDHVAQLHRRLNGYQHLGQLYHERKKEADHYRAECERLSGEQQAAGASPVAATAQTHKTGVDEPHEMTTSGAYSAIHRLEESLQNWSLASSQGNETSSALTSGESQTSELEGVDTVMTWLCRNVGMANVSPLALVLIQAVLSVLAKEREVSERQAVNESRRVSLQTEGQPASRKQQESSQQASTSPHQQNAERDAMHAAAVAQLQEQARATQAAQQQVRRLEDEKRQLEMNQRLWVIEKDCMHDQLRSLQQDMGRMQQENSSLRLNMASIHTSQRASPAHRSDARERDIIQQRSAEVTEMNNKIEVLRHQVNIYREDFEREREDRERVSAEKAQLHEELLKVRSDLETRTHQLLVKEMEHGVLAQRFDQLSHEFAGRIADWGQRPLVLPPNVPPQQQPQHYQGPDPTAPAPAWDCLLCTFRNPAGCAACRICNSPRVRQQEHQQLIARGGRIECDTARRASQELAAGALVDDLVDVHSQSLPSVLPRE